MKNRFYSQMNRKTALPEEADIHCIAEKYNEGETESSKSEKVETVSELTNVDESTLQKLSPLSDSKKTYSS